MARNQEYVVRGGKSVGVNGLLSTGGDNGRTQTETTTVINKFERKYETRYFIFAAVCTSLQLGFSEALL